jgi:hypothetical protein
MIVLFCMALVVVRILYSVAEIYFERDWPRHTWRGLLASIALFAFSVSIFA